MHSKLRFAPFSLDDLDACMALFDANCPDYFAANERADYFAFLEGSPKGYQVGRLDSRVVAAFGLSDVALADSLRLSWIMVSPNVKGVGVGDAMMQRVQKVARSNRVSTIEIAASHLSAPFFAKYGALQTQYTVDGWGAGMHRVDMIWNLEA